MPVPVPSDWETYDPADDRLPAYHTTQITLQITYDANTYDHPAGWFWPSVLDLPNEHVLVLNNRDVETELEDPEWLSATS